MSGGTGADVFVIGGGDDSILGFSEAEGDRLQYQGEAELLSTSTDAAGNTVLTLRGGGTVPLVGYSGAETVTGGDVTPERLPGRPATDRVQDGAGARGRGAEW